MENGLTNELFFERLANAEKSRTKKHRYLSERDWTLKGARTFKRMATGFCRDGSIKSELELTALLMDTGVVPSFGEARDFVSTISSKPVEFQYDTDLSFSFTRLSSNAGHVMYQINYDAPIEHRSL